MKCDICHINKATIHIQEIIKNEEKSLHICTECAAKKSEENPVLQGINLAEMLYNLSEQLEDDSDEPDNAFSDKEKNSVNLVCDSCNWDTEKFRETGRLGCGKCYETFGEIVSAALKNMHKGVLHVGKHPGYHEDNRSGQIIVEIMKLQKELELHIQSEEYEKAAVLRDKINELKLNT